MYENGYSCNIVTTSVFMALVKLTTYHKFQVTVDLDWATNAFKSMPELKKPLGHFRNNSMMMLFFNKFQHWADFSRHRMIVE